MSNWESEPEPLATAPVRHNPWLGARIMHKRNSRRLREANKRESAWRCFLPGIYVITCLTNGKVYVGQATDKVKGRNGDHRKHLRAGTHGNQYFQRAWNKHGEDKFVFEVLELCEPERCTEREQYWMDRFRSYESKHGYNLSPTAGSNLGCKYDISEETRERLSENAYATLEKMWGDPERKAEMLAEWEARGVWKKIGEKRKGQKPSPETVEKVTAALREFYGDRERSAEVRKRIGEVSAANWQDESYREKQLQRMVEDWADPEKREQRVESLRKAMKKRHEEGGYEWSDESRAKASESSKAYFAEHPEAREKVGEWSRKNWTDPEYRRRQVERMTGRVPSEEQKQKQSDALKGKKKSAEHAANIRAGQQALVEARLDDLGEEKLQLIADDYEAGLSINALTKKYGLAYRITERALQRKGTPLRNIDEAKRNRKLQRIKEQTKTCPTCGDRFVSKHGTFCSNACRAATLKNGKDVLCTGCGESFYVRPCEEGKRYCSDECQIGHARKLGIAGMFEVVCQECGAKFSVHHYRKDTAKFCGSVCFGKDRSRRNAARRAGVEA